MAEGDKGKALITKNKKAFHDFNILQRVEAGIALLGTEVKSVKSGNINLKDGYCFVRDGEVFLRNVHIGTYRYANRLNHEPMRERKLLLHREEIRKLHAKIKERGFTLVPLLVYQKKGRIKVEIGLVQGKKLFDKKEDIKKRDISRDLKERYGSANLSGNLK